MAGIIATAASALASAAPAAASAAASTAATATLSSTLTAIATNALTSLAISSAMSLLNPQVGEAGRPIDWTLDPDGPIPFAAGRVGAAGAIVHKATFGPDLMYYGLVSVLSGAGPIKSFVTFKADEETVTFDGNGKAISSQWANEMWMRFHGGNQPAIAAMTSPPGLKNGATLPGWGSSHRLNGKAAYMKVMGENSKRSAYPNGETKPLWVIEGLFGWDPRQDGTYPGGSGACRLNDPSTWVYLTNPILWGLKWSLGLWEGPTGKGAPQVDYQVGGIGAKVEGIDVDAFVSAANVADANGWTVAAYPTTDDDKAQVLDAFLQAGGAIYAQKAGKISCIQRAAPRTSIVTISAADTAGPIEFDTAASRINRINTLRPRFWSEANRWQMTAIEEVTAAAYQTEDGGKRTRGVDFPYVPNATQAAQLAALQIANTREGIAGTIPLKPHLQRITPGDAFTITEAGFVLDGLKCLCLSTEYDPATGIHNVTFVSETDAKYPFALGQSPDAPESPALTPVDPTYVTPPLPGDWTITPRPPVVGGGVPGFDLEGIVSNDMATSVLVEWGFTDDPTDAGNWQQAYLGPPTVKNIPITGVDPGATYYIAVSYIRDQNTSARMIYGPYVAPGLIAGDLAPGSPVFGEIDQAIENALGAYDPAVVIADELAALDAAIDAADVRAIGAETVLGNRITGNPNALVNPTFADGMTGWEVEQGAAWTPSSDAENGVYALSPNAGGNVVLRSSATARMTVAASKPYTFSFDLNASGFGTGDLTRIDIRWYDAAGAPIGYSTATTVAGVQPWTRRSHTATSPSNAASAYVRVYGLGLPAGARIRARRGKFEPGSLATAYSEDAQSRSAAASISELRATTVSLEADKAEVVDFLALQAEVVGGRDGQANLSARLLSDRTAAASATGAVATDLDVVEAEVSAARGGGPSLSARFATLVAADVDLEASKAEVSVVEALEARTDTTEADIIGLDGALAAETLARSQAITTVTARAAIRNNLTRNGAGEQGVLGITQIAGPFAIVSVLDNQWGRVFEFSLSTTGTFAWRWPSFPVQAGATYSYTMDSAVFSSGSSSIYTDVIFTDAAGGAIPGGDGGQTPIGGTHDFSDAGANRNAHATSFVAPAGAVFGYQRVVLVLGAGTVTFAGVRQLKAERGALPTTAYSSEATDVAFGASITENSLALVDLETNMAIASWEVVATASGGNPARIRLVSSGLGSAVALDAPFVFFGANTVFDDATDTMQTVVGSYRRVVAYGAPFGAASDLLEWWGPSGTALSAMTTANGLNGRMTTAPGVFDNVTNNGNYAVTSSHDQRVGTRSGAGSVTSNVVTLTPVNAKGTMSYQWTFVYGDNSITATSPTGAATAFNATVAAGEQKQAMFAWRATDSGTGITRQGFVGVGLIGNV